ncbi:MAG: hypothetical protein MJE77_20775, partial [Proteobacteria bacterium]|nr:hypothetical protein [Pseudomonadota bacterium]
MTCRGDLYVLTIAVCASLLYSRVAVAQTIAVDPNPVDFATPDVGTIPQQSFAIDNTAGVGDLVVTAINKDS